MTPITKKAIFDKLGWFCRVTENAKLNIINYFIH